MSGNTFNADNAMTKFNGTSMSYDSVGELTSDGTNTYTWNARHQLTQIAQGRTVTASFAYDAFGRRESKNIGASTTEFLYDGLNPVQEQTSGGGVTANLLDGLNIDEYFTRTASGTTSTFLADALGSTIGLVTANGGPIATSYSYEPFGATTQGGASNTNPYQFTGRENDGSGLYYYRARYYSPGYGRFISQDPIGFAGGDWNLYRYALDAPPLAIDPSGLATFSIGFSVNLQLGPLNFSGSVGIAVDTAGNFGTFQTVGVGAGAGAEGNGGIAFGYSNAQTICDLAGPFANADYGAGEGAGGSFGVFTGGSPDGQVTGGTLTLGLGGGAGSGVGSTFTHVNPLF